MIDSGVQLDHPGVGPLAGVAAFDGDGCLVGDAVDRHGHGTAVAVVIRECAPAADLLAVKIFDPSRASTGRGLAAAIVWSVTAGAKLVNVSLGSVNPRYKPVIEAAVRTAVDGGSLIVAAAPEDDRILMPGQFPDVLAVSLDPHCPDGECVVDIDSDRRLRARASGHTGSIVGVPTTLKLGALSFAVAKVTGLLTLALEGADRRPVDEVRDLWFKS